MVWLVLAETALGKDTIAPKKDFPFHPRICTWGDSLLCNIDNYLPDGLSDPLMNSGTAINLEGSVFASLFSYPSG
jgi:hypothetical protein